MVSFRYIGHFGFKGHAHPVIIGLFLPYIHNKYFWILLIGSFFFNFLFFGFKEECEPKSQSLAEKKYD